MIARLSGWFKSLFCVRILPLRTNDIIVLRFESYLTIDAMSRIKAQAREVFPGHKVLILQGGEDLTVLHHRKGKA